MFLITSGKCDGSATFVSVRLPRRHVMDNHVLFCLMPVFSSGSGRLKPPRRFMYCRPWRVDFLNAPPALAHSSSTCLPLVVTKPPKPAGAERRRAAAPQRPRGDPAPPASQAADGGHPGLSAHRPGS